MVALSVVIPAHNEADNLPALIAEIHAALAAIDYEIIVADDCSSDNTPEVLKRLSDANPKLRVLRHTRKVGQSSAIVSAVKAARGEWIVTMDGDGQNDPADIPAFWGTALRQAKPVMIGGWRQRRNDPFLRIAFSRVANRIYAAILQTGTRDAVCGMKMFRRAHFLGLPQFDHMHRFLPVLFQRAGADIISLPVNHRPRLHGKAHYGIHNRLWGGIIDVLGLLWLKKRAIRTALDPKNGDPV